TPSAVTTLPAAIGTEAPASETAFRTARRASSILSWWPCAASTTSPSTPAPSRAFGSTPPSPSIPLAGAARSRPAPSGVGRHVDARVQQGLRLDPHVAVDPDGGRGAQPPGRVEGGPVQLRPQRAERGEQAGEPAFGVEAERDAPRPERLEHLPRRRVQRQRERVGVEHLGQA